MRTVRLFPDWPAGRIVQLTHESRVLGDNPWGDPCRRVVNVYLPPGYTPDGDPLPVIWYLAAYTNSGLSVSNWRGFAENLGERLDRLIAEGHLGPTVVVAPDCFTSLGGNQYIDSPAIGSYARYVHEELVPFVEQEVNVLPGRDHRAVVGKSSGGYAAIRFGMEYPDHWAAIADQSGDCHFDVVLRGDFATAAETLSRHDGNPVRFIEHFWDSTGPSGSEVHTLMLLCLAASYDPGPGGEIRLPFDPETLELNDERWARWLEHDPIRMLETHAGNLKKLAAIYMDCGNRDQYQIHYGMRILSREMERLGIVHHYEEFEGTHSNIDWRLDHSLPFLYRAISPD